MKALLINGPPRSGKDTIGKELYKLLFRVMGVRLEKFAFPITEFLYHNFQIRMERVEKDVPHPRLFGCTPREVAIRYSEEFCKPLFGNAYFGNALYERNKDCAWPLIVTDSGFLGEADALVQKMQSGVGLLQLRLHRAGTDFTNDSRSLWAHPEIKSLDFYNNSDSIMALRDQVKETLFPIVRRHFE